MKYLYIGVVILILCLVLCITTTALLSRYTQEVSTLLMQAQSSAEDDHFESATEFVDQALHIWTIHHDFFGIVLHHAEADTINTTFRELREYGKNACDEEFGPKCASLIAQINHLIDMEKPYYYNILSCLPA